MSSDWTLRRGASRLSWVGRAAATCAFQLDSRDARTEQNYCDVIGDDNGLFGCMSLLACHDVCPKELPLQTQIAFLRRKMLRTGLR